MNINGPKELGVPLPQMNTRGPRPVYLIEDLEVGESRLFHAKPKNVRSALWPRAKALGFKIITATEGEGLRVWRVE